MGGGQIAGSDAHSRAPEASTALVAGVVFPAPLKAAGPTPTVVSQSMIEAARRERMVAFYTAMEIPLAESLGRAFEAKYPGLDVRVKRSGAERVFQRIPRIPAGMV
jgi:iron(III) transport system substrate-binding protein